MQSRTVSYLSLVLGLCFPAKLAAAPAHSNTGDARVVLGAAFDSLTGEIKPPLPGTKYPGCVSFDPDDGTQPPPTNPGRGNFDGYIVHTAEDLQRHTATSISGSFGYGIFNASASYQALRDERTSGESTYAVIDATWSNGHRRMKNVQLLPAAKALVRNPIAFRQACGDTYVSDIELGAQYEARITVESHSRSDFQSTDESITASLEGPGGLFGGDINGKNKTALSQIMQRGTAKFENSYVGDQVSLPNPNGHCPPGDQNALPHDLDGILQFAATLSCRAAPGNMIAWHETIYPGMEWGAYGGSDQDMARLMKIYTRYQSVLYALSHTDEFGPLSVRALNAERDALSEMISTLKEDYAAAVWPGTSNDSGQNKLKLFRNELRDFAKTVRSEPVFRVQIAHPDVTSPGEQPVISDSSSTNWYSDNIPLGMTLTAPFLLSTSNDLPCPDKCIGPSHLRFRDRTNKLVKDYIVHNINEEYEVPANSFAPFQVIDTGGNYNDNRWPSNAGIMIYERIDPPALDIQDVQKRLKAQYNAN